MSNKKTIKQLEAMFRQDVGMVREEHLKQTICLAGFKYRTGRKPGIGLGQYILGELYFTGKYMGLWKAVQALAVFVVMESIFDGQFLQFLDTRHIPFILCCIAFTAVWSAVPVLYRSARCKMGEIEAAARLSWGRRLVAQMMIMVSVETVFLLVLCVAVRMELGMYPGMAVVYFCIPYLAGIAVLMYCLRHMPVKKSVRLFAILWTITMCVFVLMRKFLPVFYEGGIPLLWAAAGIALAVILVKQAKGIWKDGYALKWA